MSGAGVMSAPPRTNTRLATPSAAGRAPARGAFAATVLIALLACPATLPAHPISLTTALVDVRDGKITVELDVMVEDLVLYYELDHDADFRFPKGVIEPQAQRHRDFLLDYFQLRDGDGERFAGEIVDVDLSEIDDDGVHIDDLMAYSIIYTFEFPLERQPDHLTVFQNFGGRDPIVPAEMDTWIFHDGTRLEQPVQLAHSTAHTVELDWDAPPDADGEDDLDDARERVRERDVEDLGIAGYSRVYGYVYVTRTQVRHELLIPLLTVETWLDIEREEAGRINVEEQQRLSDALFEFLSRHNHVRIDGTRVRPELERVDFFGPGIRDFAEEVEPRPVSVYNARVGVIVSFPAETPPEHVEIEWHHFTEQMPYYRPALFGYDDQTHDVLFDPYLTQFEWTPEQPPESVELVALDRPEPIPHLSLPALSLLLLLGAAGLAVCGAWPGRVPAARRVAYLAFAGALALGAWAGESHARIEVAHPLEPRPELDDDDAHRVFAALHENIYRAFEKRDEQRIYDALERSVAGPLLEELYLEVRRGLTLQEQGGAVSRVDDVQILEAERGPADTDAPQRQTFEYRATWTVTGTVEHWGHVHTRKNQYEAVFTIEGFESGWRITDFRPVGEQRLEMRTRLRS